MLSKIASSNKPFLVIGRAGMDLYPDPAGTKTEAATQFFAALGGSSANIAVALRRFNEPVALVTNVSNDAVGRFVVNQLENYGVDSSLVRFVSGECRTSLALAESRVEDHQSVIYRNNAADFTLALSDISDIDFSSYRALIITGTALTLEPSRTASLSALRLAKDADIPCIMDLDYRPYSWESESDAQAVYQQALTYLDAVIGNDDEFGHMAGGYDEGESYAKRLARSGKWIVYKRGELGSRTFTPVGSSIDTGIFQVNPLKPTGAGDSFLGGLLASLSRGSSLSDALVDGSACAAMVVTRVGCAPAMPDLEELTQFKQAAVCPHQSQGV